MKSKKTDRMVLDDLISLRERIQYIGKHAIKQQLIKELNKSKLLMFGLAMIDCGLIILIYSLWNMSPTEILKHCIYSVSILYAIVISGELWIARQNRFVIESLCSSCDSTLKEIIDSNNDGKIATDSIDIKLIDIIYHFADEYY